MRQWRAQPAAALAVGLVLCLAAAAALPPVERLVEDVKVGPDAARIRAMQLLPHCGAAAVPGLVALMGHEDPVVATAAYHALWYVVNELARPVQDAERLTAAQGLLPLLAPERRWDERDKGLKLLAVTAPEGFDVTPVASLLGDEGLGDKARVALERMGTKEARAALRQGLQGAEPERACALMASLAALRDRGSVPLLVELMAHGDARVRAAAALGVAWTGDPALAAAVMRVCAGADGGTIADATDAELRLAEAMATQGGNWDRAIALYRDVLDSAREPRFVGAAIVGLARYGDETVVAPIVKAVKAQGMGFEPVVVTAFGDLRGAAASKQIVAALPQFSRETQLALVEVLGQRGDAAVLPGLAEAAKSEDGAFRLAALRALGATRQPEAMKVLAGAAASDAAEESQAAQTAALALAEGIYAKGFYAEAGHAFVEVLELARTDEVRQQALDGIARCPDAGALEPVVAAAQANPSLGAAAGKALRAVAEVIAGSDRARALGAYQTLVTAVDPSAATAFACAARIRELGGDPGDLVGRLGVVRQWRIVGPFDGGENDYETVYVNEPDVDPAARYRVGEADLAWKPLSVGEDGQVDLLAGIGNVSKKFAYAYAEVTVEQDTDATVLVGSDDGFRLWVNGELVKEVRANRGMSVDSDRADVRLRAGKNVVLLKVYQNAMGWGYCVRLTDRNGAGLSFTQPE